MSIADSIKLPLLALPGEPEITETVLRASTGWIPVDWDEIWHFRELLYFLAWRDLKVRYKQTSLGVAWAVLQPVFNMIVFTVLARVAHLDSDGFPYPVFSYAALLPWTFFSTGASLAGQSLLNQQNLLTKIYFPRLFIPTAAISVGLVDMVISFGVYAIILVWYHTMPSWQVVFLPVLVVLTTLATLGVSFTLAALTVTYRDLRFVIPFLLQAMMFLCPIIYKLEAIPAQFQWLYALNPMAGIIDAYRSAILGTPWHPLVLGISSLMSVAVFVFGLFYFKKTERIFADLA